MNEARIEYLVRIILTIVIDLFARRWTYIPGWSEQVLWATILFYLIRFVFSHAPIAYVIIASFLFCYLIDVSRLYQADWINRIRLTTVGGLMLGRVFSWGDMFSYSAGVIIALVSVRKVEG